MEKKLVKIFTVCLLSLMLLSFVSPAWEDFDNNTAVNSESINNANKEAPSEEIPIDPNDIPNPDVVDEPGNYQDEPIIDMGEGKYTQNFFIAIGISVVGVLILIFLLYALLRKSKNKWEK